MKDSKIEELKHNPTESLGIIAFDIIQKLNEVIRKYGERLDKLEKAQKHQHDEWVDFFWKEAWRKSKRMEEAKEYVNHLETADHEKEYIDQTEKDHWQQQAFNDKFVSKFHIVTADDDKIEVNGMWEKVADFIGEQVKNAIQTGIKVAKLESQPEEHLEHDDDKRSCNHKVATVCQYNKKHCPTCEDPSPKKECEHEFTKGWPSSVHCKKCGYGEMQLLDMEDLENSIKAKKVIYTSEGDAVGEVGGRCEHQWTSCLVVHPEGYYCPPKCMSCGITKNKVGGKE